jgi:peptide-methionine (S)-S-oxide reductase
MENINAQTITLAGGCFWCTEAVFNRLIGVESVTSGYANGREENPSYEKVSSGETDAAEAVQIKFDPKVISLEKILEIFWATHDPTTTNQQGNDIGTEYRSAIFYTNQEQSNISEESKMKMQKSGVLKDKSIVTEISPLKNFYTAEEYHQNYYEKNKNANPYCSLVIAPKIQKLLDKFNSDLKDQYRGRVQ